MKVNIHAPITDLSDRPFAENGQLITLGHILIRELLMRRGNDYAALERGFETARRVKNELEKNGDAEALDFSVEEVADMVRLLKQSDLPAQVKVPAVRLLEAGGV